MKLLHRMILRALPGPFFAWLGTLMFLLVMQFLIRYLPDIAGRGLPLGVIIELIAYNLSYMVVLAVPMSTLLASLMVFGRLAESKAYAVAKNAGISVWQLLWPTLLVGVFLTGCMTYFNNIMLPESNFRARNLWQDIRSKKPGFELQPGVFYNGINEYSILVQDLPPESNELIDVLIFDYTDGTRRQSTIKAQRGTIETKGLAVDVQLEDGEIHRLLPATDPDTKERYERIAFDRYRLTLDLADFVFERSDPRQGYRSDRTTPTADMIRFVDSLQTSVAQKIADLDSVAVALLADSIWQDDATDQPLPLSSPAATDTTTASTPRIALAGLSKPERQRVYNLALENVRTNRALLDDAQRTIVYFTKEANRYRVEIHKKFSIAVACLVFMLIGVPLGLSIRRGGLGTIAALALGIFMFYWITLVQGEKLADRDYLTPWVGMWIANIIMLLLGLWLIIYVALDLRATPRLSTRLRRWVSGSEFRVQGSTFSKQQPETRNP